MREVAAAVGSASLLASDEAFKRIIDDETVPEGIPWATPHEELKNRRKAKVPAKVKSIRGKLNVPRERSTCAPRPNISGRASNSAIEGGCEDRIASSLVLEPTRVAHCGRHSGSE